ncbi:rhodanese-like domain-containing protein [Methylococcus sp. EFPC2]|uniref:rhodanese-like domain-containing protein n=1 Tax=Methylococcus sp. EFPC2 TaxID=2812648 RepID=UPI00196872A1|nr:rhodanese-like domain-containing protein [Methylococcus sp. EFPC2]QSA97194.1 sulfurtransferase [Methylococcus sp. EFPC2]
MDQITPSELKARLDRDSNPPLLLDVREPIEFKYCRIDGSLNMPMNEVFLKADDLDPDQETVVICHHGLRSAQIANFLIGKGFRHVVNLQGGVAAWANTVDPHMPTY